MAPAPFTSSEMAAEAQTRLPVTGTPEVRFGLTCIEYFRQWADTSVDRRAAGAIRAGQALVMVYAQNPETESGLSDALLQNCQRTRRHLLTLEEGVAVCTENLETMLKLTSPITNADDAMEFVEHHLSADHEFAILLMDKKRVLLHHPGLDIDTWIEDPETIDIDLAHDPVTETTIAEALKQFHALHTLKPLGRTARLMWDTSRDPVGMHHKPELHVQTGLLGFLEGRFREVRTLVDEEHHNPGGRVDIRVQRFDRVQKSTSITTMLELKVLNPSKNQTDNYKWALSSLEQSDGYREEGTDACFACIYDARRDQSDPMADLDGRAKTANVRLERFPMIVPPPSPSAVKKTKAKAAGTGVKVAATKAAAS